MRYAVLVAVLVAGCKDSAKDREIAELRAKLAENSIAQPTAIAPPSGAPSGAPAATPEPARRSVEVDPRAEALLRLCVAVEEHSGALFSNLGIKSDDVIDEYGHIKDPMVFCGVLRERMSRRFGKDNSHVVLVNTFGAEIGTRVWNGALCAPPPIEVKRRIPTREELLGRFTEHIKRNVGIWAYSLHVKASEILDERGEVRDPPALVGRVRALFVRGNGKQARRVLMLSDKFGGELGAAIFSGRLETPSP